MVNAAGSGGVPAGKGSGDQRVDAVGRQHIRYAVTAGFGRRQALPLVCPCDNAHGRSGSDRFSFESAEAAGDRVRQERVLRPR